LGARAGGAYASAMNTAARSFFALLLGTLLTSHPAHAAEGGCAFGDELARAFTERDEELASSLIDMSALGARAATSYSDNRMEQAAFKNGMKKTGPRKMLASLFKALETSQGTVKCMPGPAPRPDRALLRFDLGDSGFDYLDTVLEKDAKGRYRVVDWFQLSRGEMVSVSIGALGRLMSDPSPHLIQSLFGLTTPDKDLVQKIKLVGDMQREGKYAEAVAAIDNLPKEVAESRLVLSIRLSNASFGQLDDEYKKTLAVLARKHSADPAAAVMLLDYYFFEKQTEKVLQSVSAIEQRVGVDGLTTLLRANACYNGGDYARAITHAREALRLEPDREDPWHSLAMSFIGLKKYPEAIEAYQSLATDFGYEFQREHFVDAQFAGFVKSAAFKRWLPN
jgi:tetratricopeptide (TPR) repeat protein